MSKLTLPWHIGFHNEIGDNLATGHFQPGMVRYQAVNICATNGRHVAWACSPEHAQLIVESVNQQAHAESLGAQLREVQKDAKRWQTVFEDAGDLRYGLQRGIDERIEKGERKCATPAAE